MRRPAITTNKEELLEMITHGVAEIISPSDHPGGRESLPQVKCMCITFDIVCISLTWGHIVENDTGAASDLGMKC